MSCTSITSFPPSTQPAVPPEPVTAGRLRYVGHATVDLEVGGTRVVTDPVLRARIGPLRRYGARPDPGILDAADVIAVSHLHHDHLDLPSLRRFPPDIPVIVPRGAGALAARAGAREVLELVVGEEVVVGDLTVRAVPAEHDDRRGPLGPSARPLGYVFESHGLRAYFAGDTDLFAGMAELRPLDLALLPVWGWGPTLGAGHMDPAAAARALDILRPGLAIPIHWGTFFPVGLRRLRPGRLTGPPVDFAQRARSEAPGVPVQVLQPGGETLFGPEGDL
ncbi:MAG TPA: MBL fold metallo-hydrolase [Solirubrobacterales bacterium]|nr:MBL fold metallo-hydrolase [Solirubrobacterales bacterium]